MNAPRSDEAFTLERKNGVLIFTASSALENIDFNLHKEASDLLLGAVDKVDNPLVVVDLAQVDNFGSMFLAILLRAWKVVEEQKGGSLALAGVSPRAKELLRMTALSDLLPIYDTRQEALQALL